MSTKALSEWRKYFDGKLEWEEEVEERLDDPSAPSHPDESNGFAPTPDGTMEVTSGRICFGLHSEVKSGAKEKMMTCDDAWVHFSDLNVEKTPHNVEAKNGKWNAYKLIHKSTYGECEDGWFLCHEDVPPLEELRDVVYNTFDNCENGGMEPPSCLGTGNYNTTPFHYELGYTLISRYALGYKPCLEDEEEEWRIFEDEGMFVVDHADAKKEKSQWKNAINQIHTCGDFDIGRLMFDEDRLCTAILLTGRCVNFKYTYFVGGSAPIGWPDKLDDQE